MPSAAFNRLMRDISEDKVLIPVIKAALSDPDFQEFFVHAEGWHEREYDGWFHPSSHSTWTVRQLWLYLTAPKLLPRKRPNLLFVLAVTQGKFWHDFVQTILFDRGMLMPQPGWETAKTITDKVEVPILDRRHKRKGHADGRINADELFEFKTMNERMLNKLKTVDDLREQHPGYYAQTQDYLDVKRAKQMRYLVMQLSSPFTMVELVVPADPEFQAAQRERYSTALQHQADQTEPKFCCTPKSKESKTCPVRTACPIGRLA